MNTASEDQKAAAASSDATALPVNLDQLSSDHEEAQTETVEGIVYGESVPDYGDQYEQTPGFDGATSITQQEIELSEAVFTALQERLRLQKHALNAASEFSVPVCIDIGLGHTVAINNYILQNGDRVRVRMPNGSEFNKLLMANNDDPRLFFYFSVHGLRMPIYLSQAGAAVDSGEPMKLRLFLTEEKIAALSQQWPKLATKLGFLKAPKPEKDEAQNKKLVANAIVKKTKKLKKKVKANVSSQPVTKASKKLKKKKSK